MHKITLYEHIKYEMNLDEIRNSKYMHHSGAHKILKRGDLTLKYKRDPLVMENSVNMFRDKSLKNILCFTYTSR